VLTLEAAMEIVQAATAEADRMGCPYVVVQAEHIAGGQSPGCDGACRNQVSWEAISSAARSIASLSWPLAVGEMCNRASAHLRSASAYFASTQAIQGSAGVSLSAIDTRPVVI